MEKNSKYHKLLTAGCSFTASPSDLSETPITWAGMLAQAMGVSIFSNLAIPGGGNTAAAVSLVHFLHTKRYFSRHDTLVMFNITGLERIDTICSPDHPDANTNFSWGQDLGFGWITEGEFNTKASPFFGGRQKHQGHSETIVYNTTQLISAMAYLNHNQFDWYFMIMDNNVISDAPDFFKSALDQNTSRWIRPQGHASMHDFCLANNLLEKDNFHPNNHGHRALCNLVGEHIV